LFICAKTTAHRNRPAHLWTCDICVVRRYFYVKCLLVVSLFVCGAADFFIIAVFDLTDIDPFDVHYLDLKGIQIQHPHAILPVGKVHPAILLHQGGRIT